MVLNILILLIYLLKKKKSLLRDYMLVEVMEL